MGTRPVYISDNSSEDNSVETNPSSSDEKSTKDTKRSFDFPDGGWECRQCQNYNFKGRKECFRCKKAKDEEDFEGKPEHMLRADTKSNKKQKKTQKPKSFKKKSFNQDG